MNRNVVTAMSLSSKVVTVSDKHTFCVKYRAKTTLNSSVDELIQRDADECPPFNVHNKTCMENEYSSTSDSSRKLLNCRDKIACLF